MKFVKIKGKDFEMADAPVTQKEYESVMGINPSSFKDKPSHPVETVSWNDAQEFIKKLNEKKDGYTYRLPTEEEWEYCCRAGSKGDYCFGDEKKLKDYAWYWENSKQSTQPVHKKKANKFGLYDMHGNVWEWCQDLYDETGSDRVLRGGSWGSSAQYLRSAYRGYVSPGYRDGSAGFRLVRTKGTTLPSNTLTLEHRAKTPASRKRLVQAVAKVQEALDELKEMIGD